MGAIGTIVASEPTETESQTTQPTENTQESRATSDLATSLSEFVQAVSGYGDQTTGDHSAAEQTTTKETSQNTSGEESGTEPSSKTDLAQGLLDFISNVVDGS